MFLLLKKIDVKFVVCVVYSYYVIEIIQCNFYKNDVFRMCYIRNFVNVDFFVDKKTHLKFFVVAIVVIRII